MRRQIDKSVVINRVKRTPAVIFIRGILPFVILFLIMCITFLVGVWNVKEIEYDESKLSNISTVQLDSYLSEFVGKNIFTVNPDDVKSVLINNNKYIKDVYIKKVLPSKLSITINEFLPLYVGYSSDRCILFSDTGSLILELCTNCEEKCIVNDETKGKVYIKSTSVLESEDKLIYFNEISKVQKILSEFGYFIIEININNGIAEFTDEEGKIFVFDLSNGLDTQLARMYAIGGKINEDIMKFSRLDLRFKRPVMDIK